MGIEPSYTMEQKPRDHLLHLLPKVQEELPPRTMKVSLISLLHLIQMMRYSASLLSNKVALYF